ncbi:hypothetical protein CES85_2716 [Ochrobactrum quorumnocens]|uniref:Uncharacterized protein n=1 Tax=Ochrobactrum quorumnocens TaxID=271865 RepID=A0A248UHJ7_9HYPH|nr:hypothetical protein CES85_2716 [[Ochrobactrum] quorumnocens]
MRHSVAGKNPSGLRFCEQMKAHRLSFIQTMRFHYFLEVFLTPKTAPTFGSRV